MRSDSAQAYYDSLNLPFLKKQDEQGYIYGQESLDVPCLEEKENEQEDVQKETSLCDDAKILSGKVEEDDNTYLAPVLEDEDGRDERREDTPSLLVAGNGGACSLNTQVGLPEHTTPDGASAATVQNAHNIFNMAPGATINISGDASGGGAPIVNVPENSNLYESQAPEVPKAEAAGIFTRAKAGASDFFRVVVGTIVVIIIVNVIYQFLIAQDIIPANFLSGLFGN